MKKSVARKKSLTKAKRKSPRAQVKKAPRVLKGASTAQLKKEIERLKRQAFVAERLRFEKSKASLKETKSQMALLAAGVSHEFNNILGAIEGHAEWALSSQNREDLIEALEVAKVACARSSQITRALQGLAQVSEESMQIESARNVVLEVERLLSAEAKLLGIDFEVGVDLKKDSMFYGSSNRIIEVLVNLVRNGMDALQNQSSANKQKIVLSLSQSKSHLVFRIEDSGRGVDPSIAELIFQPFFTTKGVLSEVKAESSRQNTGASVQAPTVRGGSGLGLYLSRSIAQEHGGDLELVKAKVLEGAAFELSLPVVAAR